MCKQLSGDCYPQRIATGTPPGVGMGHKPQKFLKEGDVMSASIEKLGAQRQKIMRDA